MIFCNLQQLLFGSVQSTFSPSESYQLHYIFYLSQNTGKPTFENVVGKILFLG